MNTKLRTMVFRRKEFQEFLSTAKNSLIKREGSTRMDEIKMIKSSGKFTPGTLVNTPDFKSNMDTIAEKYCSYIVFKKINLMTETGLDEYEQILIYQGTDNGKEAKAKYGLTKDMEAEIYYDPKTFFDVAKDVDIRFLSQTGEYSLTVTNKVIRGDKERINIGIKSFSCNLSKSSGTESVMNNVDTEGYLNGTLPMIIQQTKTLKEDDKSSTKVKYLILDTAE